MRNGQLQRGVWSALSSNLCMHTQLGEPCRIAKPRPGWASRKHSEGRGGFAGGDQLFDFIYRRNLPPRSRLCTIQRSRCACEIENALQRPFLQQPKDKSRMKDVPG